MTLKKTRHGNKVILFSVQFFQKKRRWLGLLMILSSSRQNFEKLNVGLFLCLYRECQSLLQLQEQRKHQQYGPIPSKHCLLSACLSFLETYARKQTESLMFWSGGTSQEGFVVFSSEKVSFAFADVGQRSQLPYGIRNELLTLSILKGIFRLLHWSINS